MADDTVTASFECAECGGTTLILSNGSEADSMASCKDCGFVFGSWTDVNAKVLKATMATPPKFKLDLKGFKHIKRK